MPFLVFTLFWFLLAPPAIARIAMTLAREHVFESWRAWVDARWPDRAVTYLVNCPVCLSYWIAFGLSAGAFALNVPAILSWSGGPLFFPLWFLFWLGATDFALRWWLPAE